MRSFYSISILSFACASAQVELDDARDALSLLQVHVKKHGVAHKKEGPVEPYVDPQGRCCTADLSQRGQGVLGPCEGVAAGENTLWWLRNELVDKRFPSTIAGPFRKMGLVDPSGRTIKQGYVKNEGSDSDKPDPNWQNSAAWLNGPGYTIVNIQCGECPDAEPEPAPANCPAGQVKTFFKTSGNQAMCSDSSGFRVKECADVGAALGLRATDGRKICPSVNGAWPTEGCFEFAGTMYDSTCAVDGAGNAGNTFDSHMPAGFAPHNGICFKCEDDPNADTDVAEAVGDPHLTTKTGSHFDMH